MSDPTHSLLPAGFPGVVCATQTSCKCCGAMATLYGVVDFHKSCADRRQTVFAPSGIPIYYYRCGDCRFLFSTALDQFRTEDFRRWIYNDDYPRVDPDYLQARPQANAALLSRLFAQVKPRRLLDYGAGNGQLIEHLRTAGFPEVAGYDPFVAAFAQRPQGPFDCVCAFEVAEHSVDPLATFTEITGFLSERGLVIFSTLLQPDDLERQGLSWWYVGPRNGHVSLFSRASLVRIATRLGFQFGSFSPGLHVFQRPPTARAESAAQSVSGC